MRSFVLLTVQSRTVSFDVYICDVFHMIDATTTPIHAKKYPLTKKRETCRPRKPKKHMKEEGSSLTYRR